MEGISEFWSNVEKKAKRLMPVQVFPAVVSSIDEESRTCVVKFNETVEYTDVRLFAVVKTDMPGFCLIPKQDSTVLVGRIAGSNELYVVMFSEIDKVLGSIGENVEVSMDADGITYKNEKTDLTVSSGTLKATLGNVALEIKDNKVSLDAEEVDFNGGGNKGLAKVEEIKKNFESLKQYVETMNNAVVAGLNGVGAGPTASGAAGAGAYQGAMAGQSIMIGDMENPKVKH